MALRCPVKISAVNNLSDARYVAGMGVDFMGFNIEPGAKDGIDPQTFEAITGWVSGVSLVGEITRYQSGHWEQIKQQYPLDLLQISEPYESALSEITCPLMIRLNVEDELTTAQCLKDFKEMTQYYVVEAGGSLFAEKKPRILEWCRKYPILLEAPLLPEEIDFWLQHGLAGIALKGGHEIKPGYKDFDDLADMLEALEIDDLG